MIRRTELLTTLVVAAVSLAWGVPAEAASLGLPSEPGPPASQSTPLNQNSVGSGVSSNLRR